jgi:hypothetical protein
VAELLTFTVLAGFKLHLENGIYRYLKRKQLAHERRFGDVAAESQPAYPQERVGHTSIFAYFRCLGRVAIG